MRQSRPQIIDGLWQCLCPSFDVRVALHPRIPNRWERRPRASSSTSGSVCYATRPPVTIIPSHPRNPTFYKPKHLGDEAALSKRWSRQVARRKESLLDPKGRDVRALETNQIHWVLQHSAEHAYVERVQEIVSILIRERGEKPGKHHYQALINVQASLEYGSAAEVERLLQEMQDNGIELDAGICSAFLKALAIHPHYMLRQHILKEMEISWVSLTERDHNYVAAGLLKECQFELAWDYLAFMRERDHQPEPWLFHLFLYSMTTVLAWPEVHVLLDNLPGDPQYRILPPLWSHLLLTAAQEQYQPVVKGAWNRAVKLGYVNPSSGLCTTVLESCAANGDTEVAADVFRVMTSRSTPLQVWHYESLLEAYLTSQDMEGVISTIKIMTKSGFPLTEATTRSIYTFLRNRPEMVAEALAILSSPSSRGRTDVPTPLILVETLLESMNEQGDIFATLDVFHTIGRYTREPATISTFNILLEGCAISSRKDIAMDLASEMRERKISPDALTYDRLILVCLSSDSKEDFEDAWKYYYELRATAPAPNHDEAKVWGLRRETIQKFGRVCVSRQDKRIFKLLDDCISRGIYVKDIQQDVDTTWHEAWGS